MSYGKPEQICHWRETAGYKKFLKKAMSKVRRLVGKRLMDDAQTKDRFRGYSV